MTPTLPCPLCNRPVTPYSIGDHVARWHPEHHVELLEPCPHGYGAVFLEGPVVPFLAEGLAGAVALN